jgi:NAD(P)H-dependent FMN reductase
MQIQERSMTTGKIRVAVIYGSTREGRFCDTVARWAASEIENSGEFELEVVDPAETAAFAAKQKVQIGAADAFMVVTPEYNHGYPAPLKALIDSMGVEWHAKPVAFVSYGGVSGGLRAVEQLRLVFAELHAATIRETVSFAGAWEQFDEDGKLREPERPRRSMTAMLARLHWWATALREARNLTPYPKPSWG